MPLVKLLLIYLNREHNGTERITQQQQLKPHQYKLIYLTLNTPSLAKKKKVLNQQAGFLPAPTALIAPLAVD